jgi:hypothetical protein
LKRFLFSGLGKKFVFPFFKHSVTMKNTQINERKSKETNTRRVATTKPFAPIPRDYYTEARPNDYQVERRKADELVWENMCVSPVAPLAVNHHDAPNFQFQNQRPVTLVRFPPGGGRFQHTAQRVP